MNSWLRMTLIKNIGLFFGIILSLNLNAQFVDSTKIIVDFEKPVKYNIEAITISGNDYTPDGLILLTSGLKVGQSITIPGDDTK
ncbi:MAG: hypothetical protein HN886_10110, partial [Woeseiaceae bacterium]|nr:hypothetical protein [Woeseiaceae bacterium]